MSIPRVIPVLLLRGKGLVKTIRFADPKYVGDPVNAIRVFNEKEVDELLLLDIRATVETKRPDFEIISAVASECFMPLGYGGGLKDVREIEKILGSGVEKTALNSAVFEQPKLIEEAAKRFGSQSIVVSMDVRRTWTGKYAVYSHAGQRKQKGDAVSHAKLAEALGAGEILVNSIDRDGTQQGYDLELIRDVASQVGIPVVACGGAGRPEDFRAAIEAGASAVSAGSYFVFYGKHRAVLITYPTRNELENLFRR